MSYNFNNYYQKQANLNISDSSIDEMNYNPGTRIKSPPITQKRKFNKPKLINKSDNIDPIFKKLKTMAEDDKHIEQRVKTFYESILEDKRKKLGDLIAWQGYDDESSKEALLDDTINVIMQARKAIMSRENEGVKIIIEQAGWESQNKIRPKYSIVISRIKF